MIVRLLLTLGTLALAAAGAGLMRKGWHARQGRQAELPAPPAPAPSSAALMPAVPGLFVGTTDAQHWLDRIAVHHLADRAAADLQVLADGVCLTRQGLEPLFLPWGSIESVSIETSLAGKVVSTGLLVIGWRLGERAVVTGFRADDRAAHEPLRAAVRAQLSKEVA